MSNDAKKGSRLACAESQRPWLVVSAARRSETRTASNNELAMGWLGSSWVLARSVRHGVVAACVATFFVHLVPPAEPGAKLSDALRASERTGFQKTASLRVLSASVVRVCLLVAASQRCGSVAFVHRWCCLGALCAAIGSAFPRAGCRGTILGAPPSGGRSCERHRPAWHVTPG